MQRTRAISEIQKNDRIKRILGAAEELFRSRHFNDIMVADIAAGAGLAKGTVYTYFSTKEAVYLALLQNEFTAWFSELMEVLNNRSGNPLGMNESVNVITRLLVGKESFLRLATILHSLLEENTPEADIKKFKLFLAERITFCGAKLEQSTVFLKPGKGSQFLVQIYILLLGCKLIATPSPVVLSVLETEPLLTSLKFSFEREFSHSLRLIILGMAQQK